MLRGVAMEHILTLCPAHLQTMNAEASSRNPDPLHSDDCETHGARDGVVVVWNC